METTEMKKKYACKAYFKNDANDNEYCADICIYRDPNDKLESGAVVCATADEKADAYRAFLQKERYDYNYPNMEMAYTYTTGYYIDRVILVGPAD